LFDLRSYDPPVICVNDTTLKQSPDLKIPFGVLKRAFDISVSLLLLPLLVSVGFVICLLNPSLNKGGLLFAQIRMGQGCKAFVAYKFRTMRTTSRITRGAEDPVEINRITRLGIWLRKSRIDELPQLINVLKGEMSLIGPRPDYFHHARWFIRHVPGYRQRHAIRPGISGLAQTEVGYVEGAEATSAKVRADIFYINNACLRLDAWITWRTIVTVLGRKGT
jgi:lipopolysaccharide/colanic/teichoic acid biosynthesis glycosyltransferase